MKTLRRIIIGLTALLALGIATPVEAGSSHHGHHGSSYHSSYSHHGSYGHYRSYGYRSYGGYYGYGYYHRPVYRPYYYDGYYDSYYSGYPAYGYYSWSPGFTIGFGGSSWGHHHSDHHGHHGHHH